MMQDWFKKAKLGIFIHWGIYAVDEITESWSFSRGMVSYDEYMKQLNGFTAEDFDADKWAKLFKRAGANYAVLTTKHHDGVALFDTKYTDLNVVKKTPAGRDLVKEYCEGLRNNDIKVGLYFTNTDWSDVDHLRVIMDKSEEEINSRRSERYDMASIWGRVCHPNSEEKPVTPELEKCWAHFMEKYKGEITELLTNYGDVNVMWFDVMPTRKGYSWDTANVKKLINTINPTTIVNERLVGYGDYKTPELFIPLRPLDEPWELCTTFNDSWGYQGHDKNYKDIRQIVRMLVECISKGGNMLISVGPDRKGNIPPEQEMLLEKLGEWTGKYYEAVYPTGRGLDPAYFMGGSTLSADKKTLYLFPFDVSTGRIMTKGIRNHNLKRVSSMTSGRELNYRMIGGAPWLNMPGCLWIDMQDEDIDDVCSVVKLEFDSEIDLAAIDEKSESVGEN